MKCKREPRTRVITLGIVCLEMRIDLVIINNYKSRKNIGEKHKTVEDIYYVKEGKQFCKEDPKDKFTDRNKSHIMGRIGCLYVKWCKKANDKI